MTMPESSAPLDEKLRAAASVPHEAQAAMIVAALEREGIRAFAAGGFISGFRAEAPGWVKVLVREDELPRAKEILARLKAEAALEETDDDVDQPE
jgi:hypothetical protein